MSTEIKKQKITWDRIEAAIEADDNLGFCLACGEQHEGCEPDMEGGHCDNCGKNRVTGAENVAMRMM